MSMKSFQIKRNIIYISPTVVSEDGKLVEDKLDCFKMHKINSVSTTYESQNSLSWQKCDKKSSVKDCTQAATILRQLVQILCVCVDIRVCNIEGKLLILLFWENAECWQFCTFAYSCVYFNI